MKEDLKEMEQKIRDILIDFKQKKGYDVSGTIDPVYVHSALGFDTQFISHIIKLKIEVNNY